MKAIGEGYACQHDDGSTLVPHVCATDVEGRLGEPAKDDGNILQHPASSLQETGHDLEPAFPRPQSSLSPTRYLSGLNTSPSVFCRRTCFPSSLPLAPLIMAATNVNPRLTPHSQRLAPINRTITAELSDRSCGARTLGCTPGPAEGGEESRARTASVFQENPFFLQLQSEGED